MSFRFSKYQGTGNDFLITDALSDFELLSKNLQISVEELVKFFCERRFGIGADGFILIEKCGSNYKWKFLIPTEVPQKCAETEQGVRLTL